MLRTLLMLLQLFGGLGAGGCLMGTTGCAFGGSIEKGMTLMVKEVIGPAVQKASEELSARTAQVQGQGSFINPGYEISGFASAGPAVTFTFTMNAVGVSANLAGAAQADAGQAGTVLPPVQRPGRLHPGSDDQPDADDIIREGDAAAGDGGS